MFVIFKEAAAAEEITAEEMKTLCEKICDTSLFKICKGQVNRQGNISCETLLNEIKKDRGLIC